MQLPTFESFYGVDFSGGRLAGRNVWVARCVRSRSRLRLLSLDRLEALAGIAERSPVLAHLVRLVYSSSAALWGFDFPFGLPLELSPAGHTWGKVFDFLHGWEEDAYGCGLECVRRARRLKHAEARKTMHHVRRATDVEAPAPFDTFHYRTEDKDEIPENSAVPTRSAPRTDRIDCTKTQGSHRVNCTKAAPRMRCDHPRSSGSTASISAGRSGRATSSGWPNWRHGGRG